MEEGVAAAEEEEARGWEGGGGERGQLVLLTHPLRSRYSLWEELRTGHSESFPPGFRRFRQHKLEAVIRVCQGTDTGRKGVEWRGIGCCIGKD